jgi:hypothetical protein
MRRLAMATGMATALTLANRTTDHQAAAEEP